MNKSRDNHNQSKTFYPFLYCNFIPGPASNSRGLGPIRTFFPNPPPPPAGRVAADGAWQTDRRGEWADFPANRRRRTCWSQHNGGVGWIHTRLGQKKNSRVLTRNRTLRICALPTLGRIWLTLSGPPAGEPALIVQSGRTTFLPVPVLRAFTTEGTVTSPTLTAIRPARALSPGRRACSNPSPSAALSHQSEETNPFKGQIPVRRQRAKPCP